MPTDRLFTKFSYALRAIRQRGVRFLMVYFRESVWFDLRHGTSTSARVPKDEQTITGDETERGNGLLYVASFTSVTLRSVGIARRILGPERFADSQFVDLGCGKGKALLVHALRGGASQRRASIGIEYDPTLAELARSNIRKCGLSEKMVSVVTDSATNLARHVTAGTLIVYIYNSFQGATMRQVLSEMEAFPHVLIYVDPVEREMLSEHGYVIHKEVKGDYNADTWLVAARGIASSG